MKIRTTVTHIMSDGYRMKLLILRPEDARPGDRRPGILWIHGGGYFSGMPEMVYFTRAKALVEKFGAVIVAPGYRLSGAAPYPAALHDCHCALLFLQRNVRQLGVRSDQIMVGGESAGGGLTAALCMYEKDLGLVNIAYQMPLYPMIDNEDTVSSRNNHAPGWNTKKNRNGWKLYLSGLRGQGVPAYAAPARRVNYTGLPPAYTFVGTAEPFYAETVIFIDRLKAAGIPAAIDIYPGMYHAFDVMLPFSQDGKTAIARFERHFAYAAEHFFAPQP